LFKTSIPAGMTSLPIPSPGMEAIRYDFTARLGRDFALRPDRFGDRGADL
jgi:hypothetical protein